MNEAAERTEQYHQQFKAAQTDAERQQIASDYRAYYAQLTDTERAEADRVRAVHFNVLKQELEAFEPTLQRALEMIDRANTRKLTTRTSESAARQ